MCVCLLVCPELVSKTRKSRKLKICIQGYFLTATTVYWFLKRNFDILASLDRYLRYNSHSSHLINSNLINIKSKFGNTSVQNMGLLRHHITISQPKYQTSVVNRYVID